MNKAELIDKIAKDAKISKTQAREAVIAVIDGVMATTRKGSKIRLGGFGTFSVPSRKATPKPRIGRNPKTGEPIKVPTKQVLKFSAGPGLKKIMKRDSENRN